MAKFKELLADIEAGEIAPEPEEFSRDLAGLVDDALQVKFSEGEIKEIVSEARGDTGEGFADRFAQAIEKHAGIEPDREAGVTADTEDDSGDAAIIDGEAAGGGVSTENYESAKEAYDTVKDQYLFRNVFVSAARLELDIEAYKSGQPGSTGKAVTGGDIAMDVINLMRGNIFESIIEVVVRDYFDEKYPGVAVEADDVEAPTPGDMERGAEPVLILDEKNVVRDDGYIYDRAALKESGIDLEVARKDNPTFGQYMGADLTVEPRVRDGMSTWNIGKYENLSPVVNGNVERIGIPPVRLVELHDNHYLVDPFGKVLAANTDQNPNSMLEVGSRISSLDTSSIRGNGERLESLASNQGISVEQLKEDISHKAQESYAEGVVARMDGHEKYLTETILPEARDISADYKSDLGILEQRESVLAAEKNGIEAKDAPTEGDKERLSQISAELDKIEGYKDNLRQAIDKVDARISNIETNLEQFGEAREKLAVENGDPEGRFQAAAALEKSAAGRTENVTYMDADTDTEIRAYAREASADIEEPKDVDRGEARDSLQDSAEGAVASGEESAGVSEEGAVDRPDDPADAPLGDSAAKDGPEAATEDDPRNDVSGNSGESPVDTGSDGDKPDNGVEEETGQGIEAEPAPDGVDGPEEGRDAVETADQQDHMAVEADAEPADSPEGAGVEAAGAEGQASAEDREQDDPAAMDFDVVPQKENDAAAGTDSQEDGQAVKDVASREDSAGEDQPMITVEGTPADSLDRDDVASRGEAVAGAAADRDDDAVAVAESEAQQRAINDGVDSGDADKGILEQAIPEGAASQEDKAEQLYDEVLEAFDQYINNDTFNLYEDFLRELSPETTMDIASSDIFVQAFSELYEQTPVIDQTEGATFGDLLYEVSSFMDGSMMENVDAILDGMRDNGVDPNEMEQFLGVIADSFVDRLQEEFSLTVDNDTHIIRLGDEAFYLDSDGVTNAMDNTPSDPESLISKTADYIEQEIGGNVAVTASESLDVDLGDNPLLQSIDILDNFFDGFKDAVTDCLLDMAHHSDTVDARDNDLTQDQHTEEQERQRDNRDGALGGQDLLEGLLDTGSHLPEVETPNDIDADLEAL